MTRAAYKLITSALEDAIRKVRESKCELIKNSYSCKLLTIVHQYVKA
jgi:hypothetical protein